jgi:PAS domain S-box-containing protein
VESPLTALALPGLIAVTGIAAFNQIWLWLSHRNERLHLHWATWCAIGVAILVARYLHHAAEDSAQAHLAIRLQYALGAAAVLTMVVIVRTHVQRPIGRRALLAIVGSTVLLSCGLFIDGVVTRGPAFVRTDMLGQTFLDVPTGSLTWLYLGLLSFATSVCVVSIARYGRAMTRQRRIGIILTLTACSAAGTNDVLMGIGVINTVRLVEYATVLVALSVDLLLVHDYHSMVADMEGLVSERTAALRVATASARSAEESFRALIDASPDGVIVAHDGRIGFANTAAARFVGRDRREALAGLDPLDLVHPVDRMRAKAALDHAPGLGRANRRQEERWLGAGGEMRIAETVRVPLRFEGRDSVVTIIRDVTEHKEMQEKLQFAERMASLGTLAAGVAHEINNPMSYLLGNLEFLREEIASRTIVAGSEDAREFDALLAEAEHGARRVVHIVRDLKAFSRKTDDEPLTPVALEEILDTASDMAANQIRQRAHLERDYRGSTMVVGNRVRLGQVFLNLVVNAAQAIPHGADASVNRVVLRTYVDPSGLPVAEVEDTGTGIDPAVRARIFDPFFTTKPVGIGTGLGLSSALGIVTALGGTIEVNSTTGAGTIMRVRLPRPTGKID